MFASRQPPLVQGEAASPGLFMKGAGDSRRHVFGLQDPQTGYTFCTVQSQKPLHELSIEFIEYSPLSFLVTIVILGAIWAGTRCGVIPLIQLIEELEAWSPDMLETIDLDSKAIELRPLIIALNGPFTRVSTSLATEPQYSADASHELRTPLAGSKVNLDAVPCVSTVQEQEKYLNGYTEQ